MGVQERRQREKKEQRQRILDAALDLITSSGFAALSMRRLAGRIEYSAASIYLYFESREHIARELAEIAFGKLLAVLTEAAAVPDAVEALHAMGLAYVRYGLENPQLYRLIFMSDPDFMTAAFGNRKEPGVGMKAYGVLLELAERLQTEARHVPVEDMRLQAEAKRPQAEAKRLQTGPRLPLKVSSLHTANLQASNLLSGSPTVELAELIWMTLHGIVSLHVTCVGLKLAPPAKLAGLATKMLAAPLESSSGAGVPRSTPAARRGTASPKPKKTR